MTYRTGKISHKMMWNYIIQSLQKNLENPETLKSRFLDNYNLAHIYNDCYACEYDEQNNYINGYTDCSACPIGGNCIKEDGYYSQLLDAVEENNKQKAIELAKIIRDAWR